MKSPSFSTGLDVLFSEHRAWLKGQRVGLLSHQATLDREGASSAERLHHELGGKFTAMFGPEHGFFGQAGAGVATNSRRHPDWKIPVHSLYGTCRKPTPAMLRDVDVVVCDLQDIGARCYTYLATLRNMLEAAAENGVGVIVCDRPVPLPQIVDGPMLEKGFESFVAPAVVPLATGMTPAESARWLVKNLGLSVDLRISSMRGWNRDAGRGTDWPEFIPPSPGIRSWETGMTYLATVFSEALPGVDCGRGTNLAFRTLGAPWLKAEPFCERMNGLKLAGVKFHPYRYVAGVAPYAGRELDGVRISVTDVARFHPVSVSVHVLHTLAAMHGAARIWRCKGARPEWFDKLYGTDQVRRALVLGASVADVIAAWRPGLAAFRATRAKIVGKQGNTMKTRFVMAGLMAACLFLAHGAQGGLAVDTFNTSAGELKITFIGHGSLLFNFKTPDMKEKNIYVDPWSKLTDFTKLPKADLILITHEHMDHLDPVAIKAVTKDGTLVVANRASVPKIPSCRVMTNGESATILDLKIEAVPAYNIVNRKDGVPFHQPGVGNGYVLTFGDKRVYVAGDTENIPEMKKLQDIYIAFLPMNLPYTMTPAMAADAAHMVNPNILYPYHFGTTDTSVLVKLLKSTGMDVRIRALQ